eukprot:9919550-Lingulodinium_polyedra.AAC.1
MPATRATNSPSAPATASGSPTGWTREARRRRASGTRHAAARGGPGAPRARPESSPSRRRM